VQFSTMSTTSNQFDRAFEGNGNETARALLILFPGKPSLSSSGLFASASALRLSYTCSMNSLARNSKAIYSRTASVHVNHSLHAWQRRILRARWAH
jgi:hypothetical protein